MKNNISLQRLQNSLVADKRFKPDNLTKVLKSEIINVLDNYLMIDSHTFDVSLTLNSNGFIEVNISAQAKRAKVVGILPEETPFI